MVVIGLGHAEPDRDLVEETNLQRQTLFAESDVGRPKATAAADRLRAINSTVSVEARVRDLNARTIQSLAGRCTVLVDGLDNFETRYLLNDFAVKHGVPYVYAGAVATEGLSFTVLPRTAVTPAWRESTACLRCLFPEPPAAGVMPTCDTAGVLGPLISTVAAHEVMQTLKILLGRWDDLDRSLWRVDVWRNTTHRLATPGPDTTCPCCTHHQFPWLAGERGGAATMLCGRDAVQIIPDGAPAVPLDDLESRLAPHGVFRRYDDVIRGTLHEEKTAEGTAVTLTIFDDLRALIGPVDTAARARAIYDRYLGG